MSAREELVKILDCLGSKKTYPVASFSEIFLKKVELREVGGYSYRSWNTLPPLTDWF